MSMIHGPSGTGRLLLALPLLMSMPACSLFDSDDEVAPANLEAVLTISESGARDAALGLLCQGSIPTNLGIRGGRAPYEAVFTVSAQHEGKVASPYGVLTSVPLVVLKQEFQAEGGFLVPQPALQFLAAGAVTEGITIGVLLKDRDMAISFDNLVPGQPLPPVVEAAVRDSMVLEDQAFEALISTCSQP